MFIFTKKWWLIIGGCALGVLGLLLLLIQYNEGKQSRHTIEPPSSTIQTSAEMRSQSVKSPTAINTPQQDVKTGSIGSESRENTFTTTHVSDTRLPLDKEDEDDKNTLSSLINSLSDEEVELLKSLTPRDMMSDEEIEAFEDVVTKAFVEAEALGPKMVALRSIASELEVARKHATSNEEYAANMKQVGAIISELNSLRQRAAVLQTILSGSQAMDFLGVDQDQIEKLFEDVANLRGWNTDR